MSRRRQHAAAFKVLAQYPLEAAMRKLFDAWDFERAVLVEQRRRAECEALDWRRSYEGALERSRRLKAALDAAGVPDPDAV